MVDAMAERSEDILLFQQELVEELLNQGAINTPEVEDAFRAIPRHLFVPSVSVERAYHNTWIGTKQLDSGEWISTASAPDIMAIMLEQLGLEPGQRVLEIGAGTGYNAALMAHIVGAAGQVITLDIDAEMVTAARAHLATAGLSQVQVRCLDGSYGYAAAAPYDRIILTVGAVDIAPAWSEQLRPAGRLVLPLGFERRGGLQASIAFERRAGYLSSVSVKGCGFLPLRGAFAPKRPTPTQLSAEPSLEFERDDGGAVDIPALYRLVTGPFRDVSADIQLSLRELMSGLSLWLLPLFETHGCGLHARGEWLKQSIVPYLVGLTDRFYSTGGLVEGTEHCAVLGRPPGQSPPAEYARDEAPFSLFVRSFGPDDRLAHFFVERIRSWDVAGRPTFEDLQIKAYPRAGGYQPTPDETLLLRGSTRFVLTWKT